MPRIKPPAAAMDRVLEGWIYRVSLKNLHRVPRYYDLEDLVADGYMVFAFCRNKYGYVEERRHFMALFQRCFSNHIIDLANKHSRQSGGLVDPEAKRRGYLSKMGGRNEIDVRFEDIENPDALMPADQPIAELTTLLGEARFPLRSLIDLFYSDKGIEVLRSTPQGRRESINCYLCRLLSIDPRRYDLPELMRSFLDGYGIYNMRQISEPLAI